MYRIRTYNQISVVGLSRFPADQFEVGPDVGEPDAYMLRSHKLHGEPITGRLLAVARAGAGVNNIPIDEYTHKGIVVFNTPGANANAVKELVTAALLLASRRILDGMNRVQELTDIADPEEMAKLLEKEKKQFAGSELAGKTLGVIGLGAIGSMVANMALELDMKVAGFDPALSIEAAWRLSSRVRKTDSIEALLKQSDFVSLHVPAIEQTRHLINSETLRRFKPGLKLLNFARDHGVLCGPAADRLADPDCAVDRVFVSDTIPVTNRPELKELIDAGRLDVTSWCPDLSWILYHHHWNLSIRELR